MIAALLISICFNVILFIPAYLLKTDKLTDISYSLTFIIVATYLFVLNSGFNTVVSTILYLMICFWALRLGGYLFYRIHKIGRDRRFDNIRPHFVKFLKFWLLQGITVFIVLVPSILLLEKGNLFFENFSIIGMGLFLFGLLYEAFADGQKFKFILNPNNKNTFIHNGLWKYSRHPNYFGEICVWFGVYLYCVCYLPLLEVGISIVSPIFIFLLLRYVSGVSLLEKAADLKFGQNPDYISYKNNTPRLLPKFW